MARALTALAEQRERQARPPAARTRPDVDELVWITPSDVAPGDEVAGLVWRGADAADYAARLEDALSARPLRPDDDR